MARRIEEIEVSDTTGVVPIAREVQRSGEPKLLQQDGVDLAMVIPVPSKSRSRGKPVTESDPLFELVGIGSSGIPGGMSSRKHEALAKAYRPRDDA